MHCKSCAHYCNIEEGHTGICGRRRVVNGKLQIPYGAICSLALDPYEKKPLYHFHPGEFVLSFGNLGCNFKCAFCQNWDISQVGKDSQADGREQPVTPQQIVNLALAHRANGIAATYNEPLISSEWVADIFKLAHENDQPTCLVSNGFASKESLDLLLPLTDAANIDLKCFTEDGYKWLGGRLQVVLDTIKAFHDAGKWVELTTLVVPNFNDSDDELRHIAEFIAALDPSIPWHVSAYHADYKMIDGPQRTPPERLMRAVELAQEAGLQFVYTGNIGGAAAYEDTICPKCGCKLIERKGFKIISNRLQKGRCPNCNALIPGRF